MVIFMTEEIESRTGRAFVPSCVTLYLLSCVHTHTQHDVRKKRATYVPETDAEETRPCANGRQILPFRNRATRQSSYF